jgi:hypothetical protein
MAPRTHLLTGLRHAFVTRPTSAGSPYGIQVTIFDADPLFFLDEQRLAFADGLPDLDQHTGH